MIKWALNLRGFTRIGSYNLQTRIEADHPIEALNRVGVQWGLDLTRLIRVHIQEDRDGEDRGDEVESQSQDRPDRGQGR